jgi:diadenosine tetraphosphatase ApaH/serine/threonine PP2A family protein phosphatase
MVNQKLAAILRQFDPSSSGYDYTTAIAAGMQPQQEGGENKGHWGSVAQTPIEYRMDYNLPEDSYMMLKGAGHPTFQMGVQGEQDRGYQIIKFGDRYFSVPESFNK